MRITPLWLCCSLVVGFWGATAPSTAAQSVQRRWTHSNASENWVSKHVSIGDRGTQVFAELGPNYPARLLSSFDQDPAAPVWQSSSAQTLWPVAIGSAETKNLHASIVRPEGSAMVLRAFSSSSSTPSWTYTFPFAATTTDPAAVCYSHDGTRMVAAAYNSSTARAQVALFNVGSSTPTAVFTLDTAGPFRAFEIDDDAQLLYVASSISIRVFGLSSGNLIYQTLPATQTGGHGFSGDGSVFVTGGVNTVKVYRRVSPTGGYNLEFIHSNPNSSVCNAIAVSGDGTTAVCGYKTYDQQVVDIEVLDLRTQARTMSDRVTSFSPAGYQNRVAEVAISRNGQRIAAGLWGDETGTAREVRIYTPSSGTPVGTLDLPGSVYDLDLSADGKRLAVASKLGHANTFHPQGRIDLLELEDLDFNLRSVPRAGSSIAFEIRGEAFRPAHLLWSTVRAGRPVYHDQLGGVLYLKRRETTPIAIGATNGQGTRTHSEWISGPVGSVLYFQGLAPYVTEDWAKVTLLP